MGRAWELACARLTAPSRLHSPEGKPVGKGAGSRARWHLSGEGVDFGAKSSEAETRKSWWGWGTKVEAQGIPIFLSPCLPPSLTAELLKKADGDRARSGAGIGGLTGPPGMQWGAWWGDTGL